MVQKAKTDRDAVLHAASELLAKHGLDGFSIRAIAGVLKLAPNAIYHYFDSLETLKIAVASEVCASLLDVLQTACENKRPIASVRALAEAYLLFARKNQHHYEALLLPRPSEGDYSAAPGLLWAFVVKQVERVSGPKIAEEAAVALWAALHGLASLESTDAFAHGKPLGGKNFAIEGWLLAAKRSARKRETQSAVNRQKGEER